jgi:antagonist of KipI
MAGLKPLLEVVSPGALAMVQDLGRFGYGRYGVPPGGAMDTYALRIGNLLVGNAENDAGIEILIGGFKVRVVAPTLAAITGGNLDARLNGKPVTPWRSAVLNPEDELTFCGPVSGCRAYLCLEGGVAVPTVMNSRTTNLPARFGGHEGRPLQKGDLIRGRKVPSRWDLAGCECPARIIPEYADPWTLRVMWGPQDQDFDESARHRFLDNRYQVSPASDRTGIRLAGSPVHHLAALPASIDSEGIVAGAVQISGDGQPIILGAESISGGYRKIATVIAADVPLLGQIKPGEAVCFKPVTLEDAQRAFKSVAMRVSALREALVPHPGES